jgi:ferredoxin
MPTVRFTPSGRSVEVAAGSRLTDAIRRAGLPIASPCGDDLICGKCGIRVLEGPVGREAPVEVEAKRRNRVPDDQRLACALRVRGDMLLTADYWGDQA